MYMNIDTTAPLQAQKEILINASPEKVWKAITNIAAWPSWQKRVSEVKIFGDLKEGTTFSWKAQMMKIVSVVQVMKENVSISWIGNTFGITAIHVWELEKSGDQTKVITRESLSGWMAVLLSMVGSKFLDRTLEDALEALKKHIEQGKL